MAEPVAQYAPAAPWWSGGARYSVCVAGDVFDVEVSPAGDNEPPEGDGDYADVLSRDFVAGHEAGYVSGVTDSAQTSAHALRAALETAQRRYAAGVRAGRRQFASEVLAIILCGWAAGVLIEQLIEQLAEARRRGGVR